MKVILGTISPLKIEALKKAIEFLKESGIYLDEITVESQETQSGVSVTPKNEETFQGAKHRANSLVGKVNADLYIGLESGLVTIDRRIYEECWCVILDGKNGESTGKSSAIQLPDEIVKGLENGKTHVELLDKLGKQFGISSKDTWGVYSKGTLSRSVCMFEACRNALVNYYIKH